MGNIYQVVKMITVCHPPWCVGSSEQRVRSCFHFNWRVAGLDYQLRWRGPRYCPVGITHLCDEKKRSGNLWWAHTWRAYYIFTEYHVPSLIISPFKL